MNLRNLLFLFFLILLMGCNRNDLQDELVAYDQQVVVDDVYNPHLNGKAVAKPLKIHHVKGTFSYMPGGECGDYFLFTTAGTGQATHFGKHSTISAYCVLYPGGPPVPGVERKGTITTANGDQIFIYQSALPEPGEDGYYNFFTTIDDGTGRFSGASGEYVFHVKPSLEDLTWEAYGEGYIIY